MRAFLAIVSLASLGLAAEDKDRLVRATEALSPEAERAALHVPPGFSVQLFASEPMINKPINIAFDAKGRLWVSSTVEYPFAAEKSRWADAQGTRVKDSRDAIKVLEDTDGDGRADKVTDFADGLNIPTGVLPWHKPEHQAGCIAWSIPNIWYFADTDGDGRADLREVLFGPLGYEKDTHGMVSSLRLGLDGWVYATHGFNNTSVVEVRNSKFEARNSKPASGSVTGTGKALAPPSNFELRASNFTLHSGNTFRFRPDGSAAELYTSGQVNPFGLCWDRWGHLYSADCHSNPITQLIRGACYSSFGKPHDGLGFAPVMCEHSHGSTGLCGIVYIDGGVWGSEWDDHILVGNCVTSRVNHDLVTFTGSTPKANERPDFLTSDDPWFRPVDLQLGPDSALYIADFYNRIIGHYEVPLDHPGRDRERGRVWRIVPPAKAQPPAKASPADARVAALRQATAHGFDHEVTPALAIALLAAQHPQEQIWAATALQAHPQREALQPLLATLQATDPADATLIHTLRLALREHLRLPSILAACAELTAEQQRFIDEISLAVPTGEAAQRLMQRWQQGKPFAAGGSTSWLSALPHLAKHLPEPELPQLITLAQALDSAAHEPTSVVEALHRALLERGSQPPAALLEWAQQLALALLDDSAAQTPSAMAWLSLTSGPSPWCVQSRKTSDGQPIDVISSLNQTLTKPEQLTGTLRSQAFAAPARLSFYLCGHQGFPSTAANGKNLVRLLRAEPVATGQAKVIHSATPPRSDVAQRIDWDLSAVVGQQVLFELVDGDTGKAYAWLGAGGFEPPVIRVGSFVDAHRRQSQLATLASLLRTTAPVGLRDRLAVYLPKPTPLAPAKPQPEIDALIRERVASFAKAKPDAAKGQQLFATHCAVCHTLGGKGALIGPQLDGIGKRGIERLAEDILDPWRNVDAHFRLHTLQRRDGSRLTGFIRGQVGQAIIVADALGQEQRVAKADIAEDKELPQSLMPPAFGQVLDAAGLHDLLGYLLSK